MSINLRYLTLKRFIALSEKGDTSDLIEFYKSLPTPLTMRIGFKRYKVPQTLDELIQSINWEQRLFLAVEPENYLDGVLRMFDCWFYSILTGKEFSEKEAYRIGKKALNCNVDELLPFAEKMQSLVVEMLEFEQEKTAGATNKTWLAAGGAKLAIYADMVTIDFLANEFKCTQDEVMEKPYADCLVRLMRQKDTIEVENEYQRLTMLKYSSK